MFDSGPNKRALCESQFRARDDTNDEFIWRKFTTRHMTSRKDATALLPVRRARVTVTAMAMTDQDVLEQAREVVDAVEACAFCGGDGGEAGLAGFSDGDTGYVCLACVLAWV